MLVAVAGTKDSPGVTTVAYGLACLGRDRGSRLLVEADPDGGALAARLGISQEPGLGTLAAAGRHEIPPALLTNHAQAGPTSTALIVAPSAPSHVRAALRTSAEGLSRSLASLDDITVVIDLGRLDAESPSLALAASADRVVFLTRPTLEGADALAVRLADLESVSDLRSNSGIVTVGEGPYGKDELAESLGVSCIGHLPADTRGVEALWSAKPNARRRPFIRALEALANALGRSLASNSSSHLELSHLGPSSHSRSDLTENGPRTRKESIE